MKLLYFGTVCDMTSYERILENCKARPTVATIVFESALLDGLRKNDVDISVHSFPMIPDFPKSRRLYFGGEEEQLACGYTCRWLKTINLPVLKQWSRNADVRRVIKKWARENCDDGMIITYSIPPFMVKTVMSLAKKYHVKTVAIIPDLPQNMYINHKKNFLEYRIKNLYLKHSLKYCGSYDGYIYLTEAMKEKIAPQKPYIVMEGICQDDRTGSNTVTKSFPRGIMYAGRLHEKYGIVRLLEAFELLEEKDVELWLFGDGTAVEEIKKYAQKDSRIRYFGRVSRAEILRYEKKATLLINPRSVRDEFTKYSFPSKTIEYMHSGTPLLTTELEGIPKEYFNYMFHVEDNHPELLSRGMREALSLSSEQLCELGLKAKLFVSENKNATVQGKRVKAFLSELLGEKL